MLEELHIAKRVHALPEAVMAEGDELALLCQPFERLLLKDDFVALDVVQDLRLKDEVTSIDPPFGDLGLFGESRHSVPVQLKTSKPRWWADGSHRCQTPMGFVESHQIRDVNVSHPVTVGHHEGFGSHIPRQPLESTSGLRLITGVDEMDDPVLGLPILNNRSPVRQVHGDTASHLSVVKKVSFGGLTLVSEGNDKLSEAKRAVGFHDMP